MRFVNYILRVIKVILNKPICKFSMEREYVLRLEKKRFNNKVVIVTGGSRGIGKEIVECLAKSGFYVILNYKSSEEEAIKIKANN